MTDESTEVIDAKILGQFKLGSYEVLWVADEEGAWSEIITRLHVGDNALVHNRERIESSPLGRHAATSFIAECNLITRRSTEQGLSSFLTRTAVPIHLTLPKLSID
jgi:hypothetical protein